MKELLELESWADTVTNIFERGNERPLPLSQDIKAQAIRKYPGVTPDQAMTLFMADKIASSEKMDFEQNKLINAQKRENEKLRRTITDIGQELQDHEIQAQQTDIEVARLKDLSSKLGVSGSERTTMAKADADKVEAMLQDLQKIQSKSGMDEQKYKELVSKVNDIKKNGSNETILQVQSLLQSLEKKSTIDSALFNQVMAKLEQTQSDLEGKEQRFRKSLSKNKEQIGQWGNKFADLNKQISTIEKQAAEANQELAKSHSMNQKMQDDLESITQILHKLNPEIQAHIKNPLQSLEKTSSELQQYGDETSTMARDALPTNKTATVSANDDAPMDNATSNNVLPDEVTQLNKYRLQKYGTMNESLVYEESFNPITTMAGMYKKKFPMDIHDEYGGGEYSMEQLLEIIDRTIHYFLISNRDQEIGIKEINSYLLRVRQKLHQLEPFAPELPGIEKAPPRPLQIAPASDIETSLSESLLSVYERQLTKLSNGW